MLGCLMCGEAPVCDAGCCSVWELRPSSPSSCCPSLLHLHPFTLNTIHTHLGHKNTFTKTLFQTHASLGLFYVLLSICEMLTEALMEGSITAHIEVSMLIFWGLKKTTTFPGLKNQKMIIIEGLTALNYNQIQIIRYGRVQIDISTDSKDAASCSF